MKQIIDIGLGSHLMLSSRISMVKSCSLVWGASCADVVRMACPGEAEAGYIYPKTKL